MHSEIENSTLFTENDLRLFSESVFIKMGCNELDAQEASNVLIKADLRGIDSHGLARLSGYFRLYEADRINPKPNIKILRERGGNFTVDGDGGLGLIVAPKSMEMAIEKSYQTGVAQAAITNSNHFGIAAYHAMMCLPHDCIGMAMTNASPLVSPINSKQRMLGTNPICYAIPAGEKDAFVMDMASSAAANGKLEIAQRNNSKIPDAWLVDKNGNKSESPADLKDGGSLLPLGSIKDNGGHKGYGLGALVDILSGVLSGANYGPYVPPFVSFLPVLPNLPGKGLGHFLSCSQIDGFMEKEDFYKRMDHWIETFENAQRINENQKVIIHGQPEIEQEKIRRVSGIPLHNEVIKDLKNLAEKLKINHPF